MSPFPKAPVLYEIDTWPWPAGVRSRCGRPVTPADVPGEIWGEAVPPGTDAVWLILDYVPNHVAPDHPWITAHPRWFIRGVPAGARFGAGDRLIAYGRDPHLPPWHCGGVPHHPVVVNLSGEPAQARIALPQPVPARLTDLLDGRVFDRDGVELFVDLPAYGHHLLAYGR